MTKPKTEKIVVEESGRRLYWGTPVEFTYNPDSFEKDMHDFATTPIRSMDFVSEAMVDSGGNRAPDEVIIKPNSK